MSTDCDLQETRGEITVKWKVKKFSDLTKKDGTCIVSSTFLLYDAEWALSIYPSGEKGATGYVSLFLRRIRSSSTKHRVTYTLGVLNNDDSEFMSLQLDYEFTDNVGNGFGKLVEASEILGSKDVMDSEGAVNFFCSAHVTAPSIKSDLGVETVTRILTIESLANFVQNFEDLFVSGRHTDTTIKFKDRNLQAHRVVLAARSSVFSSMFEIEMSEKETGIINIEEFSLDDFRDFLLFMYTSKMDHVTHTNAPNIYKIAHKYNVNDLKKICVHCMSCNLTIDSFCDIFLLSSLFDEMELLKLVTDFFRKHFYAIIPHPKWCSFLVENPVLANELLVKFAAATSVKDIS